MKKFKELLNTLTHPSPEPTYPLIAMYSNKEIVIEQVDELLSFSQNNISFYCHFGTVEAKGENLYILLMKQHELVIHGTITEVKFYPNEKNK